MLNVESKLSGVGRKRTWGGHERGQESRGRM